MSYVGHCPITANARGELISSNKTYFSGRIDRDPNAQLRNQEDGPSLLVGPARVNSSSSSSVPSGTQNLLQAKSSKRQGGNSKGNFGSGLGSRSPGNQEESSPSHSFAEASNSKKSKGKGKATAGQIKASPWGASGS